MNDTSLISSATTEETPSSTEETKTETPAVAEADSDTTAAEKLYDKEDPATQEKKDEDDPDPKKGDDKTGDDKSEEKDEQAEDQEDSGEDEKSSEPLDLSDMEFDLPEGMEISDEILTDLGTLAGELGITKKEDAAKFVPLGVKIIQNTINAQQEQYAQTRSDWRDAVAADKEIGGVDDRARKEKLVVADKGLTAIGSPELRTLLNETGLGDHPEVIRAFYKAGVSASEDVLEAGGSGDTAKGGLDAMYPTMAGN